MSESEPFVPPARQSSQSTGLIVALIAMAVVAALCILLAIAGFLFYSTARTSVPADVGIGRKLPAVNLQALTGDGGPIGAADLEGRVVLINMWATWCPPCVNEFPHIVELYDEFGGRDDFMLLSLPQPGRGDEISDLKSETEKFIDGKGVEFSTYIDPTAATINGIMQVTDGSTIPRTLVLDRTGVVRDVWVGYGPGLERKIKRRIEELLEE